MKKGSYKIEKLKKTTRTRKLIENIYTKTKYFTKKQLEEREHGEKWKRKYGIFFWKSDWLMIDISGKSENNFLLKKKKTTEKIFNK